MTPIMPGEGDFRDMYEYEQRLNRPTRQKLPDFERDGRLKHVVFAQQLSRPILESIGRTATMIREFDRARDTSLFLSQLLAHKRVMLYFTQTSTRTFSSFEAACHLLGIKTSEVRDPALSSEYKGETPIDSMRMYSSYNHLIVMRAKEPNLAERCAYLMNDLDQFNRRSVPIINAGSGADEHPTQALLDLYTLQRTFQFTSSNDTTKRTRLQQLQAQFPDLRAGLDDKTYTFCGDIGRGRTVRSLCILLSQYDGVKLQFVSPGHDLLCLQPDLRHRLLAAGVKVSEHRDLSEVIDDTDVLYMTRVQTEHDHPADRADLDAALSQSEYKLTGDLVARMRSYAAILHPFPRVDEIPVEIDHDPRALYFEQAANGMYVRAALLAHLFNVDSDVAVRYNDLMSDYRNYNTQVLRNTDNQ